MRSTAMSVPPADLTQLRQVDPGVQGTADPTYGVSLLDGSSGDTSDKSIEKEIVSDSHRHRGD